MQIASHLPHAGTIARGFFTTDAENAYTLGAEMAERAYRNFAEVGEVAGLDQHSSESQHFEAVPQRLRYACSLDYDVSAPALGEATDKLQPVGETCM